MPKQFEQNSVGVSELKVPKIKGIGIAIKD